MLAAKLTELKPKYIIVLYSLTMFAAVWIFVLLVYLPQTARNNELRQQLQAQQQQVKIVESFALAHPEADKYLTELDKRQAALDKMLPNNPDIGEFVLQVEWAARDSGVQVTQMKPSAPVNKEGYREIPVEILAKGNFFQTAAFIKKLEDSQRFVVTQNLSMQSKQGIIDSKISVSIYSFGLVAAPQVSAQQTPAKTNKK